MGREIRYIYIKTHTHTHTYFSTWLNFYYFRKQAVNLKLLRTNQYMFVCTTVSISFGHYLNVCHMYNTQKCRVFLCPHTTGKLCMNVMDSPDTWRARTCDARDRHNSKTLSNNNDSAEWSVERNLLAHGRLTFHQFRCYHFFCCFCQYNGE